MAESAKAFISGGVGGMALVFVGHPLDLIKVRLQTSTQYTGMVDCFKKTLAKEGVPGLYKGMAAPLAGITPIFAVYFLGFDWGKNIARSFEGKKPDEPLSIPGIMFAGGFSALPGTAVMVPGDRIKVILQAQDAVEGGPKYNGPIDCAKQIYKADGIRGLYRGTALTLLRDGPGSVAYYGAYEIMKGKLIKEGETNPLKIIFCGGMAGVFNWIVAVPPDVLKSRFQLAPPGQYNGIMDVARELIQKEGVGSLYKGIGPALLRSFPANAACFLGVETSRKFLDSYF